MAKRKSPGRSDRLNEVGAKLAAIRKSCGLTQPDLVARLQRLGWEEIHVPLVSMIERGKRGLSDIEVGLFLRALGKSWGALEETLGKAKKV
jgi:transcriptional regulator with XRE-family HTH domain